ncbi:membrane protein insertase YidC [Sphingobium sp. DEHP117]|uniref:membrane protein insertase YidC n=1 Tax=Sphingobium sp. DEHP117 TaxID=2993436 RepID=UPI0027D703BE|nr:membrane protein insertase YidC [Sphingobium sp. DEHP117]MDQ4421200.1 membrane protein insertase YidC [Sphingobium sp. DEHP117]
MDDKRNLILAVLLTGLILFGWPYVAERLFPGSMKPAQSAQQSAQPAPSAPGAPTPGIALPAAPQDRASALRQSPRVIIETPKLTGSIALKGARIDDITLPTYRQTIKKDSPPITLFSPAGTTDAQFAGFGWAGEGLKGPDANTVWQASGSKLTPTTPVTLRWDNGAGQLFEIALSVDANYMITARQSVTNRGPGAVAVRSYGFISRVGHSKDPSTWTIHTGPIGVFDGAANYDIEFKDLDESGDSARLPSSGGWIGFTDHYWLSALVPDQKARFEGQFRKGAGETYQADMSLPPVVLAPGRSLSQSNRLFVGAKEVKVLEAYQDSGVTLFDRAIDWGWFYWFEKPIFALLHWLFTQIGNFGVAIICLTFVVRALMFPIAQKQFASMAAMRAIQPKMKALQEKHKDDKPKLQQELMDLYKKEKVNPFSGCMPIFLQIPIFFALYKVLQLTIEMRHQPFALWIKDLSAPDPLHVLNLFGLLPFEVPAFLGVGVLAIILGITMWLQFKLNPAPMDEVQKQIFALMPWMMMFIMAPFAAGLLIYWITSNILTIAQQKWLYSRHPQLQQAPAQ